MALASLALGILGMTFAWLPIEAWFKIPSASGEVVISILCLAGWVFLRLIQGQLAGPFRAAGKAYKAQHWDNAHRLVLLLWLACGAWCRWQFSWMAGIHLAVAAMVVAGMVWDLKRNLPEFCPRLDFGDWRGGAAIVRPSLFFGLSNVNQFLVYEASLLILNRTSGPAAVVAFATGRTLFSAARQLLTPVQHPLFPEITRCYGAGDNARTRQLFDLSEAVAWVGGATLICGLAVASPMILRIWLADRTHLDVATVVLMAATGLACLLKDNKCALQQATNCHERSMAVMTAVCVIMVAGWWVVAPRHGINGVTSVWLAGEIIMTSFLLSQNRIVLGVREPVAGGVFYAVSLAGIGGILAMALVMGHQRDFWWQATLSVGTAGVVAMVSARLLGRNLMTLYRQFAAQFFEGGR
jgi:O-antigen/teichoic acid export membrane protein